MGPQLDVTALRCDTSTTRVVVCERYQANTTIYAQPMASDILARITQSLVPKAVVIENIDDECIAALGNLDIHLEFFSSHRTSPSGNSVWDSVFSSRPTMSAAGEMGIPMPEWHADGVYQFGLDGLPRKGCEQPPQNPNIAKRPIAFDPSYGWAAATRWSYCRPKENIHMFLVDAPLVPRKTTCSPYTPGVAQLHFPVSENRGGLVLPHHFGEDQQDSSLLSSLAHFFAHGWHFSLLQHHHHHQYDDGMWPGTFIYFWASSTWTSNFRHLDGSIKRIAFKELPSVRPSGSAALNNRLHTHRRDLASLRAEVEKAGRFLPRLVHEDWNTRLLPHLPRHYAGYYPRQVFEGLAGEARLLEGFLVDTFQLLMSSMSVLASETSLGHARFGEALMRLASVYLPLSFVAGVFGMNLREINGSSPPWWACLLALAVVGLGTYGLFSAYDRWEEGRMTRGLGVGEVPATGRR